MHSWSDESETIPRYQDHGSHNLAERAVFVFPKSWGTGVMPLTTNSFAMSTSVVGTATHECLTPLGSMADTAKDVESEDPETQ